MDPELKALLEEQGKTFDAFKAANDGLQAEVKKLGAADAVTAEKVEKLSKALDEAADKIKAAQTRADDIEAKANRLALNGGSGAGADEAKHAADFAKQTGQAVTVEDLRSYKGALDTYMRKGDATPDMQKKALSVGSDPDGGYAVTPDTSGRMMKKVYESSPIRQLAFVQTLGTDSLEGPIDNGEADAGWVGEKQARNETGTPQLGKWAIPVHEVYAMPAATQKILEDNQFNLEGWLEGKVSDKIARVENGAFVKGDGNLKPRGLLDYPVAATPDATRPWGTFEFVASGANGAFAAANPADKIIDLIYSLKAAYRSNARFLMARTTVAAVRKLKDGQGNYLWQPSAQAGQPATLLDYGVAEAEDMPGIAANSLSIGFGDIRETYTILDRVGISVLRDPFTRKGWVLFYTRKRTGGGAVNFEAFKLMKFAA
jgi:HK97 family phage major capsid protein